MLQTTRQTTCRKNCKKIQKKPDGDELMVILGVLMLRFAATHEELGPASKACF
jgi:hypothetical protein